MADGRALQLDQILESARIDALASVPPPASTPASGMTRDLMNLAGFRRVTDDDRAEFHTEVERYLGLLRTSVQVYDNWRRNRHRFASISLRFANTGRVPADDVRITLDFPSSFVCLDEKPALDVRLPEPPRFKRRSLFPGLDYLSSVNATVPFVGGLPPMGPNLPPPNLRGPWVTASPPRYSIGKLLHGVPIDPNEPVFLRIDADGTYEIHWSMTAGNVPDAIQGTLHLKVTTEELTQPRIDSLDGLVNAPGGTLGSWTAGV